jgi:hypothetical protein
MIGEEDVGRLEVGGESDLGRLLPETGVEHPGHIALSEFPLEAEFERTDHPHVAVQAQPGIEMD